MSPSEFLSGSLLSVTREDVKDDEAEIATTCRRTERRHVSGIRSRIISVPVTYSVLSLGQWFISERRYIESDKRDAQLSGIVSRTWTKLLHHYIIYSASPYSKGLPSTNCKESWGEVDESVERFKVIVVGTVGAIRNMHEERCHILENEIYEDTGECHP